MPALVLVGCGSGERQPLDDATPQEVVAAYVAALNAHDERAALGMLSDRLRSAWPRTMDSPIENVIAMRNLEIGLPRRDPELGSARRHAEVLYVPVTFDLEQRQVMTRHDGPTTWGYVLARVNGRWLIDDEGVG